MNMKAISIIALSMVPLVANADVYRELGRMRLKFCTPTCITIDSAIDPILISGFVQTFGEPINEIRYSANMEFEGESLTLADEALVQGFTPNGARYYVLSQTTRLIYPIDFLRRAPVGAGYDPATMFEISYEVDGGEAVFMLDYRDAQ